jgi:hypothetical protein
MDIDAIPLGEDFVEVINEKVGQCDVLIAVIGRQWLSLSDARGEPRINDSRDLVRIEISAALESRDSMKVWIACCERSLGRGRLEPHDQSQITQI